MCQYQIFLPPFVPSQQSEVKFFFHKVMIQLVHSFQVMLDIENGFLRAWWVDPLVATISFAVSIHFYWYHERKRGLSRDSHLADTIDLWSLGDLTNSLYAYWIGILILHSIAPSNQLGRPDGIPSDFPSFFHLIGEVVSGIICYDALFFVVHWMLHECPSFRRFHRRHHASNPPNSLEARDVLRHSLIDGILQVMCNVVIQQSNHVGGLKSRFARVLHNIMVTWMLTESHCASPEPNIWRRWFVGVRNHRIHHLGLAKKGHESYQQFFGYLDYLRVKLLPQNERSRFSSD